MQPLAIILAGLLISFFANATPVPSQLPETVVVRTHLPTGHVEVLHVSELVALGDRGSILDRADEFAEISAFDAHPSTNSIAPGTWYFYFSNQQYFNPTYFYFGQTYRYYPYYHFNWGSHSYSYYRW